MPFDHSLNRAIDLGKSPTGHRQIPSSLEEKYGEWQEGDCRQNWDEAKRECLQVAIAQCNHFFDYKGNMQLSLFDDLKFQGWSMINGKGLPSDLCCIALLQSPNSWRGLW